MTTIRMVDPATVSGKVREIFEAVLRRERTVFGATEVSNIWRCMGHSRRWSRRTGIVRARSCSAAISRRSSASSSRPRYPSRTPATTESTRTWPP